MKAKTIPLRSLYDHYDLYLLLLGQPYRTLAEDAVGFIACIKHATQKFTSIMSSSDTSLF
jgi:hypothetical protein